MKPLANSAARAAILSFTAVVVWKLLLNDEAKASLVRTSKTLEGFVDALLRSYMGEQMSSVEDKRAEENKKWVSWQWDQLGF